MRRIKLTDIPEHMLEQSSNGKSQAQWRVDYNIAAWIRFENVSQDPIRLYLHWNDDKGERDVFVDQAHISSASVLLSGIARININGQIKSMSIMVETKNMLYTVDELFVQPVRNSTASKLA